jgi:membrane protein YqaA with SNARE-associated domain
MTDILVYAGLFAVAFGAATLLPLQSEAVLAALLLGGYTPWLVLAVASLGNIAGSCVNWLIGRGIESFRHRRWFPVSEAALDRASRWYQRWGKWTLLLSWVPIIGDPLTVVAGLMREPFRVFFVLVTIAKIGRYIAIAAGTLAWL